MYDFSILTLNEFDMPIEISFELLELLHLWTFKMPILVFIILVFSYFIFLNIIFAFMFSHKII